MPVSAQAAALELIARRKARESLIDYTRYTNAAYQAANHHHLIAAKLEAVERGEIKRLMIAMPPRHGKLIADDTPVPTPAGWSTHGALQPGDWVFGAEGQPIRVLAVSDPGEATLEVEMTDGEKVLCHPLHEWLVYDRRQGKWRVMETRQLKGMSGGRSMLLLPDRPALQLPDAALPMAPYALGAWLGDGSTTKPCITHAANDSAVVDGIMACGYEVSAVCTHSITGVLTTYFSGPRPNVKGKFRLALDAAGVFGEKHIPAAYQRSSKAQRLELLAGLVDTDGHVDKNGRVRIVTADERLAGDIAELVASLGWRAVTTHQEPATSSSGIVGKRRVLTIGFQPDCEIPMRLPRKVIRRFAPRRRIGIAAVRQTQPAVGRCIQVEGGLYLAGRKSFVTHNSELASRRFPGWYLGRNPIKQIIAASYNSDLADDFGREVRNIVASEEHQKLFDTPLSEDSKSAGRWHVTKGGVYVAAGVGTAVTGRGADIFLIDDPFKDREEADSEIRRQRVWDWYTSTAYTRLMPGGAIIVINTRWHDDDLSGRLLEQMAAGADQWDVLSLPAINDDGAALWPEWYPVSRLREIQKVLPARDWNSLYQQNPIPDDGDFFKSDWFGEYEELPKRLNFYGASDYAVTDGSGDYTEHGVIGVDGNMNVYIVDWWRKQAASNVWIEKQCDLTSQWKPLCWFGEAGPIRRSVEPFLLKRMEERNAYCRIEWLTSIVDKASRARGFQAIASMGKVFLPRVATWKGDLLNQLLRFPAGKYDDAVDTCGLFGRGLPHINAARAVPRLVHEADDWRA